MRRLDEDGRMIRKKGTRTVYRIVARSELGDRYAAAFDGMRMETKEGETILKGEVLDQPHLFGILDRINGLGLELLSVQALPDDARQSSEGDLETKP
jgi:outer membrane PBP1 activator LpoA protein